MSIDKHSIISELVNALGLYRDRIAFRDQHRSLTYGQVACFSCAVGQILPSFGTVGVFGAPSASFGAACLACVLHGRPFVHIDKSSTQAAIVNVIGELEIDTVLVCDAGFADSFPSHIRLVDVRELASRINSGIAGPISVATVTNDSPIYVVSTSGTTGRPKCIPVTHQAAYHSYLWREQYLPYDACTTVGVYIFAIWEMFRPLRFGSTLCFPTLDQLMSPSRFGQFLLDNNIDEILFTPSFLERILDLHAQDNKAIAHQLKRIILNGEVVTGRLITKIAQQLPNVAVWNLYSICETHDISITRLDVDRPLGPMSVPITVGTVMPLITPYVLDERDLPVPAGEIGRLFFEGDRMLGPGYINRPEETARRFVRRRISDRECRLYDTGDNAMLLEDGNLAILGRAAHMLKLRGYSIQSDDLVEAMRGYITFASGFPWIVSRGDGRDVLVFYYTTDDHGAVENLSEWGLHDGACRLPKALSQSMGRILPRHCIPTYFYRLLELPLNAISGKCDYRALPPLPAANQTNPRVSVSHPASRMAEIAADILQISVDEISFDQSLIEHGADSLTVVEFLAMIEREYGRALDFGFASASSLASVYAELHNVRRKRTPQLTPDRSGVLLTGVTGFLGQRILAAALKELPEDQVVYCLIRPMGKSVMERASRVLAPEDPRRHRFVVIEGVLEDPTLGLTDADYRTLARNVLTTIHCAALVNLALSDKHLAPSALRCARTLIDFCSLAGAQLHFTSSSAVFPDRGGPYPEALVEPAPSLSGYGKAKIAVETEIARSGLSYSTYRLPSLLDLEYPNERDVYEIILASSARIKAIPLGLRFQMIDVARLAQFIARAARMQEAIGIANVMSNTFIEPTAEQLTTEYSFVAAQRWLNQARLPTNVQRYLEQNPSVWCADATYDNQRAARAFKTLMSTPLDVLSPSQSFLQRRLATRARGKRSA